MTEETRKTIIKRIKEDQNKIKIREQKIKEKEILMKDPQVQKYLELVKEITNIKNELSHFNDSLDLMIYSEFIWALQTKVSDKGIDAPCNHDIWIYNGSYNKEWHDYQNEYRIYYCSYESSVNFLYNSYVCLECGKQENIKEWEQFERTHKVLKNRCNTDANKYREIYYKLLYKNNIETAREKLEKEFYKKPKVKKLERTLTLSF